MPSNVPIQPLPMWKRLLLPDSLMAIASIVVGFFGFYTYINDFKGVTTRVALPLVAERRRLRQGNDTTREHNHTSDATNATTTFETATKKACDLLPLLNGHHAWNFTTNTSPEISIRQHTSSDNICGPKVLIIGAMKCGTNTLGQLVAKHPRIQVNRCRAGQPGCTVENFQGSVAPFDHIWEGNDFTHKIFEANETRCCAWLDHIDTSGGDIIPDLEKAKEDGTPPKWLTDLATRLPWTDGVDTFAMDKSPSYLDISQFPKAAKIAKHFLPNAKILATVCDPSLRLVSHYYHSSDKIPEVLRGFYQKHNVTMPVSFVDFVSLLLQSPRSSFCQQHGNFCREQRILFLEKGQYAQHLRQWYDVYGKENVLVINMKDDPTKIVESILDHVGTDHLPRNEYPWDELVEADVAYHNQAYEGRSSAYKTYPRLMDRLEQYYFLHNQELAKMLQADFPLAWNQKSKNSGSY